MIQKLIDSEELLKLYPALKSKRGKKSTYRIDWLVRNRAIPVVKIGRRNYFDPEEVDAWINLQKIPAKGAK